MCVWARVCDVCECVLANVLCVCVMCVCAYVCAPVRLCLATCRTKYSMSGIDLQDAYSTAGKLICWLTTGQKKKDNTTLTNVLMECLIEPDVPTALPFASSSRSASMVTVIVFGSQLGPSASASKLGQRFKYTRCTGCGGGQWGGSISGRCQFSSWGCVLGASKNDTRVLVTTTRRMPSWIFE